FSLSRSDPLPVLHSFPTRRSSDLVERHDRMGNGDARGLVCRRAGVDAAGIEAPLKRLVGAGPQVVDGGHWGGRVAGLSGNETGEDRKSTRLNSSHVAISYAVFCLK